MHVLSVAHRGKRGPLMSSAKYPVAWPDDWHTRYAALNSIGQEGSATDVDLRTDDTGRCL